MGLSKNKAPRHAKQQLNLYEEILNAVKKYHVMEPDTLTILLNESGWNVVESKLFSGDEKNNPIGVSLGNNIEMVGAHAKIVH